MFSTIWVWRFTLWEGKHKHATSFNRLTYNVFTTLKFSRPNWTVVICDGKIIHLSLYPPHRQYQRIFENFRRVFFQIWPKNMPFKRELPFLGMVFKRAPLNKLSPSPEFPQSPQRQIKSMMLFAFYPVEMPVYFALGNTE